MRITEYMDLRLGSKDLKRIGRIAGWAPGSYMGKCCDCDGEIIGDKRSIRCFVCAVIAMKTGEQSKAELVREAVAAENKRIGDIIIEALGFTRSSVEDALRLPASGDTP